MRIDDSTAEKHGGLYGGALTEEALDSSPDVLRRNVRGAATGQANVIGLQQWFAPDEISLFAAQLIGPSTMTLDFTAGLGWMLKRFGEAYRFGVEIDQDHARAAHAQKLYDVIAGDAQKAVPMMRAVDLRFGGIAINPPFGLRWRDPAHGGGLIPSVKLSYLWAQDLLEHSGQGLMLCDRSDLDKNVLPLESAKAIYAIVDLEGRVWNNVVTPVSLALFVHHHNIRNRGYRAPGERLRIACSKEELTQHLPEVETARARMAGYVYSRGTYEGATKHTHDLFAGIRQEYNRRRELQDKGKAARITHDLDLKANKVRVYFNLYARHQLAKAGKLRQLELLDSQSVNYFATNTRDWKVAEEALADDLITISPSLRARVDEVMKDAKRTSTPLFPIKPQMRLGWIEDLNQIECHTSDPARGFLAGEKYPIQTAYRIHSERDTRVKEDRKTGVPQRRDYIQERKLLHVMIRNEENEWQDFDESGPNIKYLMNHFDMPDPGDVSLIFPDELKENEQLLRRIEQEVRENDDRYQRLVNKKQHFKPFSYKNFQIDHMSRLLVKMRGLLAHEQGLGKTLMLMSLAKAAIEKGRASDFKKGPKNLALFVVPQDLIPQWQREAKRFFGIEMETIVNAEQAHRVKTRIENGEEGWWITYYEALARVGRKYEPLPEVPIKGSDRLHHHLGLYKKVKAEIEEHHRETSTTVSAREMRKLIRIEMDKRLAAAPDDFSEVTTSVADVHFEQGREYIQSKNDTVRATSKFACPKCGMDGSGGWTGEVCRRHPEKGQIGCGYVHRAKRFKPAYTHLTSCFIDGVICVDELSEIRGNDSQRSKALRALARGPYKFGGTGTPLSNYINDTFWGLWWCLGNASVAFPYDYRGGRAKFEDNFCVAEWMLGEKGTSKENVRQNKRILARVTNISQFWRLTQPGVSRCRKEQTGEPIVEKIVHPVFVPMGRVQKHMHQFALNHFDKWFEWQYPQHNMVQWGLVDKFAAQLGQRWWLEKTATLPRDLEQLVDSEWPFPKSRVVGGQQDGQEKFPWRHDVSNWTPANLKVLELAMEHASKGEKVLIGSDLIGTGHWLATRLREKGVNAVHITDEDREGNIKTKAPKKRAKELTSFTTGNAQVMCAGVQAVKLGHSMETASVVIVHGLPDSFMAIDQFVARVHRLTSEKPVSVYIILPTGSLAETKWRLLKDKGGTSDLAFDGELMAQEEEEIDWNAVLKDLKEKGVTFTGDEVHEKDVREAWKKLRFMPPQFAQRKKPQTARIDIAPDGAVVVETDEPLEEIGGAPVVHRYPNGIVVTKKDLPPPGIAAKRDEVDNPETSKPLPKKRTNIVSTEVLTVEEHLERKARREGKTNGTRRRRRSVFDDSASLFNMDEDGTVSYTQDSLF